MQLRSPGTLLITLLCLQHSAWGCPYSFSALHNFTNLCNRGNGQAPRAQITICCEEIYGAAMFAFAQYANATGHMFLTVRQAQECIDLYKQLLITTQHLSPAFFQRDCPLLASRITDAPSSCKFATVDALRRLVDLSNITVACGPVQIGAAGCQACQTELLYVVTHLASYIGDDLALCGIAVAIAMTSSNPSLTAFQAFYQCALEILNTGPLSGYFSSEFGTPPPPSPTPGPTGAKPLSKTSVILVVTFSVLTAFACFTLACLYTAGSRSLSRVFKRASKSSVDTVLTSGSSDVNALPTEGFYLFHLKELTRATNHFSDSLVIGKGSAGIVYLGSLPSGQLIAVKRILTEKKVETFNKEVELLSRVRHPNLTALLGYCQSKLVHLLVYEFMSNGDLGRKLLDQTSPALNWEQRIKIAIDCAKGLTYLHECADGPVIHRDIKPSNILLSETFEAKLSDFGLSKCLEIEASHVSTEIKGTTGYLDPEYLILGQLTEASDVYSFGVVLLQLLSGRKAIDGDSQRSRSLVQLATMVMSHELDFQEFIDPRLEGVYPLLAFQKMAEVAHCCVQPRSYDRPSISEVLDGLDLAMRLGNLHSPKST